MKQLSAVFSPPLSRQAQRRHRFFRNSSKIAVFHHNPSRPTLPLTPTSPSRRLSRRPRPLRRHRSPISARNPPHRRLHRIAYQPDGQTLAAGTQTQLLHHPFRQTSGRHDPTFDSDGTVITDLGSSPTPPRHRHPSPTATSSPSGTSGNGLPPTIRPSPYNSDGSL